MDQLRDGRAHFGCGVTEQPIVDREAGGSLEIIAGNVNRLPFDLIASPDVQSFEDMRGATVGVSSLEAGSSSLVMRMFARHGLRQPTTTRKHEPDSTAPGSSEPPGRGRLGRVIPNDAALDATLAPEAVPGTRSLCDPLAEVDHLSATRTSSVVRSRGRSDARSSHEELERSGPPPACRWL